MCFLVHVPTLKVHFGEVDAFPFKNNLQKKVVLGHFALLLTPEVSIAYQFGSTQIILMKVFLNLTFESVHPEMSPVKRWLECSAISSCRW